MRKKKEYPQEILDKLPAGFAGELALLRYEYMTRSGDLAQKLDALLAAEPTFSQAAAWKDMLAADRALIPAKIDLCIEKMLAMQEKVKAGQLSLQNEHVCRDVAETEKQLLVDLTELQHFNSDALQHVFALQLPALLKSLGKDNRILLHDAIGQQADCTQFMSNELQDLAIMRKEQNKRITHPLDENHPE
jgi:hypothetical protein